MDGITCELWSSSSTEDFKLEFPKKGGFTNLCKALSLPALAHSTDVLTHLLVTVITFVTAGKSSSYDPLSILLSSPPLLIYKLTCCRGEQRIVKRGRRLNKACSLFEPLRPQNKTDGHRISTQSHFGSRWVLYSLYRGGGGSWTWLIFQELNQSVVTRTGVLPIVLQNALDTNEHQTKYENLFLFLNLSRCGKLSIFFRVHSWHSV